ncbi:MAG TPA: LLM class flavin-dependent oxidoreductase [Bordetella sp.]
MSRKMHLGLMGGVVGSGWRLPEARIGTLDFSMVHRVVTTAERGKFDLVFFADAVNSGADASPGTVMRFEPLSLISALAVTTSHIGLVATVSTTYSEPYNIARAFASIDYLSGGRVGWNVVTGSSPDAAANFGSMPHPPHAQRYEIAAEYVEVAKGLWDSWEDGALVLDKKSGEFFDRTKLHELNHAGPHFSVKGPLNIARPPQGYPVMFQAGASDQGIDFAARTADAIFAAQHDLDEAVAFANRLRDRVQAVGRPRDAVKVLLGVSIVMGETREAARKTIAEIAAMADMPSTIRSFADRVGYDINTLDLDGPLPDYPPSSSAMLGHAKVLRSMAERNHLTVRDLRDMLAVSSHRLLSGTAQDIADDMECWFKAGAADGFVIMLPYAPEPLDKFVDEVVPILVARGLFRQDYEGRTLREHLGLARPGHPASAAQAAE